MKRGHIERDGPRTSRMPSILDSTQEPEVLDENLGSSSHIPELKKRALDISIKEGTANNISYNLGDAYITPFALALNAQPIQIGILSSISGFIYYFSQFIGAKAMIKHSRKNIILYFVFLQAIAWLLVSFVAFSVWKNLFDGYSVWVLIALYSLIMFLGGIS